MNVKKYITPSCKCYEVSNQKHLCNNVSLQMLGNDDDENSERVKGEYSDNFLWNDTKH